MLTRLKHAAIAFAITVVVYQAYVLFAAPQIEPPQAVRAADRKLTEAEREAGRQATHKYRELLAAYFPPGHWTLTQPPITAENGQVMIVIDEFNPSDDGKVHVQKCAILFFPNGRVRGEVPPSDTVILEAPQGAVLQMDKSLRGGMGSLGRLQWGKLIGQITVRSDMREPGPHDDLLLTTSNLDIREDLIFTYEKVDMRLGPHRGQGRELEIRLLTDSQGRTSSAGTNLGNLDSLEILKDVQAELSPGQVRLGLDTASSRSSSQATNQTPEAPPVKIATGGKFKFDFTKQVASFDNGVQLTQVYPSGQLDQLRCDNLAVYFATAIQTTGSKQSTPLGKLRVATIEALGTETVPVWLDSRSQEATARCGRMRIELGPRRVTFDRGHEVMLTYEGNEIHASQIRYQAPPEGSTHRVGRLDADGNGWLQAHTSDKPGAKPFMVHWSDKMELRRVNGRPVLILKGRPKLDMVGMGQLWANHLDLFLRESAADGSEDDLLPNEVVPDRLVASGQIEIDSAQLIGHVKQLEVQFNYESSNLQLGNPNGENSLSLHKSLNQKSVGGTRVYDITGDTLQMLVTVRQKKPEVTRLDVDGQVLFSETSANEAAHPTPGKAPLRVAANHLRVENADSPSAKITLNGKPATITADGMSIRTENLQINRGTSRAWVNAPGQIEMLVDRDLSGKRLAVPQLLTIHWQQSMELNQDKLTFSGNVQVQTAEGTLDTHQLVVQLTAPVQFDGTARKRRLEIAQLQCFGGVNAIFSQRDAQGLASVQTVKLEETFWVNLQNGQLGGSGPGRMESVHLSSGSNPWGEIARGNGQHRLAAARPQPQHAQRLRFLGVQFVRGIRGNIDSHQGRKVEVFGDVEAVYGPVDSWQQRLAFTKSGMPGPDTIWISSQSLEVAESPLAKLQRNQQSGPGPLELLAKGDVTIEGPAGERGNFTTHSLLAKYDQSKRTFILEGNNQQPATMTYQEFRGGPTSPTSARKITYFQETGNVKVEGLISGHLRQLAPADGR